jgi:hypothetical protein
MAGLRAAKLGVTAEPLRHTAHDTAGRLQLAAFERALAVLWPVIAAGGEGLPRRLRD